jgi:acid-activated urea channel
MLGVALLYVGAVLVINGVSLMGKIDSKAAAVMNIFTGGLTLVLNIIILINATETQMFYAAATGLLFSFTYLYVAINSIFNLDSAGLGWYCLFVAITAVPSSYLSFLSGDVRFGIIWIIWAFLWFLFFLLTALKKPIQKFTAWVTIAVAITTAWIPGYLLLIDKW